MSVRLYECLACNTRPIMRDADDPERPPTVTMVAPADDEAPLCPKCRKPLDYLGTVGTSL